MNLITKYRHITGRTLGQTSQYTINTELFWYQWRKQDSPSDSMMSTFCHNYGGGNHRRVYPPGHKWQYRNDKYISKVVTRIVWHKTQLSHKRKLLRTTSTKNINNCNEIDRRSMGNLVYVDQEGDIFDFSWNCRGP